MHRELGYLDLLLGKFLLIIQDPTLMLPEMWDLLPVLGLNILLLSLSSLLQAWELGLHIFYSQYPEQVLNHERYLRNVH